MRVPFSNVISSGISLRSTGVQLIDAWKQNQPQFQQFNWRTANKEGYKKNELVYACVREIATSVAEPEFQVVTTNSEEIVTPVLDHPAQLMMDNPNGIMTPDEWWESLLTIVNIAGNGYVLKDMEERKLWILRPDWMQIIQLGGGRRKYKYGPIGQEVILEQNEVIHIPYGVDPQDIYGFGMSPLQPIWRSVQQDNSATDFFKVFFDNAAVPSGIIKLKKRLARQSDSNRIRKQWQQRYSGIDGWHAPAVLDEDAEYQKIGLTLEELRMDTLRHVTESRICMGFGVPPILVGANVGLQRSTYSNYREARSTFWEETLAPMYKRLAQIIKKDLISEFPAADRFQSRFDLSGVVALQANRMEMMKNAVPALRHGGLTVNQFLTLIGMNPVPDGDRYVAGLSEPDDPDEDADDEEREDQERSYQNIVLEQLIGDMEPQALSYEEIVVA